MNFILIFISSIENAFRCVGQYSLSRQYQRFSFDNFGNVQVEEIAVEHGLHTASNNSNEVEEAFKVVAVDPI